MPPASDMALGQYIKVRDELRQHAPDSWNEVVRLCKQLPEQIDVAAVWTYGKDKPCWSNIRESVGNRIANDLNLSQDFESHTTIASSAWEITMRETGRSWKSNSNFDVRGDSANVYVSQLVRGGFASYKWRLYAIRQFAQSLSRDDGCLPMVRALISRLDCGKRLEGEGIYPWSKQFAQLAGRGWGATTVNHMLTDLGLSVKPDLHLRRSAVRMGLLGPDVPRDLTDDEIKKRAREFDPKAVSALVHLAKSVLPTATPEYQGSVLREMDKVLMEWSKKNLCRPL